MRRDIDLIANLVIERMEENKMNIMIKDLKAEREEMERYKRDNFFLMTEPIMTGYSAYRKIDTERLYFDTDGAIQCLAGSI